MGRSGDYEGGGETAEVEELEVDLGHVALELLVGESETLARLDDLLVACFVVGVDALDVRHLRVDGLAVEQTQSSSS